MTDDSDGPDRPGPGDLQAPFLFVPHGAPEPTEWMRKHPGWVKFPATFVPRAPTAAVRTIPGTNRPWPLDKRGQPWPRSRFGQPLRPLDEYPPGVRAPGEAYTGPIADPDKAVKNYLASRSVWDDPGRSASGDDALIEAYRAGKAVADDPGKYAGYPRPGATPAQFVPVVPVPPPPAQQASQQPAALPQPDAAFITVHVREPNLNIQASTPVQESPPNRRDQVKIVASIGPVVQGAAAHRATAHEGSVIEIADRDRRDGGKKEQEQTKKDLRVGPQFRKQTGGTEMPNIPTLGGAAPMPRGAATPAPRAATPPVGGGAAAGKGDAAPSTTKDIVTPGGQRVGVVHEGATPNVRTVSPPEFQRIQADLMVGAQPVARPGYLGTWYQRPDGTGFDLRHSDRFGLTIDIDDPSLAPGFKVHQQ